VVCVEHAVDRDAVAGLREAEVVSAAELCGVRAGVMPVPPGPAQMSEAPGVGYQRASLAVPSSHTTPLDVTAVQCLPRRPAMKISSRTCRTCSWPSRPQTSAKDAADGSAPPRVGEVPAATKAAYLGASAGTSPVGVTTILHVIRSPLAAAAAGRAAWDRSGRACVLTCWPGCSVPGGMAAAVLAGVDRPVRP
jgi:hypothetical protein